MKWIYTVTFVGGQQEVIPSDRLSRLDAKDQSLIIQVDPHGFDMRHDYIVIPLHAVKSYTIQEVR